MWLLDQFDRFQCRWRNGDGGGDSNRAGRDVYAHNRLFRVRKLYGDAGWVRRGIDRNTGIGNGIAAAYASDRRNWSEGRNL